MLMLKIKTRKKNYNLHFIIMAVLLFIALMFFTEASAEEPAAQAYNAFSDCNWQTKYSGNAYLNGADSWTSTNNCGRRPDAGFIGVRFNSDQITNICYGIGTDRDTKWACVGGNQYSSSASIDPGGGCGGGDACYIRTGVQVQRLVGKKAIKRVRLTFFGSGNSTAVDANVTSGWGWNTTPANTQDGTRGFNNVTVRLDILEGGGEQPLPTFQLTGEALCQQINSNFNKVSNKLSWPAFSGAAKYLVLSRTDKQVPVNSDGWATAAETTDLTWLHQSDSGADPQRGKNYYYAVEALDSKNYILAYSNVVTVKTEWDSVQITSLKATPSKINLGEKSVLSWWAKGFPGMQDAGSTEKSFKIIINPGNINIDQTLNNIAWVAGQYEVSPTATTKYTVNATNSSKCPAYPSKEVTVEVNQPSPSPQPLGQLKIIGDVLSKKDVAKLNLDAKSVVSASGLINDVSGSQWKIAGYDMGKKINWTNLTTQMDRVIQRMISEYVTKITNNNDLSGGLIYLNNGKNTSPKTLPPAPYINVKPEGKVWYLENQDININSADLVVAGIGTIIIKNGNLNIEKNITYASNSSKNSLGFIVLKGSKDDSGNINIGSNVSSLNGAYYAPDGKINFQ